MRKYELMTIFPLDEEKSKKACDEVRSTLTSLVQKSKKKSFSVTATSAMK